MVHRVGGHAPDRFDGLAVGALIVLCMSWGAQQVAIKLIANDISPVMQAGIRSIGATVLAAYYIDRKQAEYWEKELGDRNGQDRRPGFNGK